jgi:hypothetical protein
MGDGEGLAVGREERGRGVTLAAVGLEGPGDDNVLLLGERGGVEAPGEPGEDAR